MLVYFSNVSNQTKRFVDKLEGIKTLRLPIKKDESTPVVDEPFILLCPSYGTGNVKRAVPHRVVEFLNIKTNRDNMLGVMGSGNKNFGRHYQVAARVISHKTQKPFYYGFEISGMPEDVKNVERIYNEVMQH